MEIRMNIPLDDSIGHSHLLRVQRSSQPWFVGETQLRLQLLIVVTKVFAFCELLKIELTISNATDSALGNLQVVTSQTSRSRDVRSDPIAVAITIRIVLFCKRRKGLSF